MTIRKARAAKRIAVRTVADGEEPVSVAGASRKARGERADRTARANAPSSVREASASAHYAGARGSPMHGRAMDPSHAGLGAIPGATLAEQLEASAAQSASGNVRRKNMNIDQGLLDTVLAVSGASSETEAVRLGLAAYVEIAAFEHAMLTGFDRWSSRSGAAPEQDAAIDTAAFIARSERAHKAVVR